MSFLDATGLGAVSSLAQDVIDKIFPDKVGQEKEREAYMLQAQQLDNQLAQGQLAINQAEAANNSVFVAGWRPFIGWVCGVAFAYHMIIVPLVQFILAAKGIIYTMPVFDDNMLNTTLMGLLGLGALRTTEKMGDKGHLPWQH